MLQTLVVGGSLGNVGVGGIYGGDRPVSGSGDDDDGDRDGQFGSSGSNSGPGSDSTNIYYH